MEQQVAHTRDVTGQAVPGSEKEGASKLELLLKLRLYRMGIGCGGKSERGLQLRW